MVEPTGKKKHTHTHRGNTRRQMVTILLLDSWHFCPESSRQTVFAVKLYPRFMAKIFTTMHTADRSDKSYSHYSSWYRSSRQGRHTPDLHDLHDLYDLLLYIAHAAGGEAYNLHHLRHLGLLFCVRSICTIQILHNIYSPHGRLGSTAVGDLL